MNLLNDVKCTHKICSLDQVVLISPIWVNVHVYISGDLSTM